MDLYEETHIKLLVRLTREAHAHNTSTRRFIALATAISDILYTIKKYHGFECLRRIIYMATAELGYSIGPLDVKTAKMLIDKGLIISNKITPTYKSPIFDQ